MTRRVFNMRSMSMSVTSSVKYSTGIGTFFAGFKLSRRELVVA